MMSATTQGQDVTQRTEQDARRAGSDTEQRTGRKNIAHLTRLRRHKTTDLRVEVWVAIYKRQVAAKLKKKSLDMQ
jgi:hypothetical protein